MLVIVLALEIAENWVRVVEFWHCVWRSMKNWTTVIFTARMTECKDNKMFTIGIHIIIAYAIVQANKDSSMSNIISLWTSFLPN